MRLQCYLETSKKFTGHEASKKNKDKSNISLKGEKCKIQYIGERKT